MNIDQPEVCVRQTKEGILQHRIKTGS